MKQSEIDRALVLVYRSNNAHDEVNFARPAGAMDYLPMCGLEEYAAMLKRLRDKWKPRSRSASGRVSRGIRRTGIAR